MRDDFTASVDPGSAGSGSSAIELLAPGSSLGDRYEIRRVIGSGGQAVVYLAHDRELRREVALKVLRPDRSSLALEKRFRREASIARDVAHPNVVRIFDIESAGSAIYLTMEHIDGESLRARIERGPLPLEEVIDIARQMLHGIEALHAIDIIHRDIKPANVLIGSEGVAKVADFGLARHLVADETKATNTGAVLGTIDYLSPEQALGKEIDFRSDLYSAGVVMFEMLAGCLPFSAKSQLGVMLERLKAPAPDVRQFRPDCPRWLAKVIARLLEQKPEERYASATEVLADIGRRHSRIHIRRRTAIAVVVVAMIVIASLAAAFVSMRRPHFAQLVAEGNGVTAIDGRGRPLWSMQSLSADVAQKSVLTKIDGRRYVAMVPWNSDSLRKKQKHVLWLIEPDTGRIARTFDLTVVRNFDRTTDEFVPQLITAVDLDHDGSDELVIPFCHSWNWPSYTMLVEPRIRRTRVVFIGSGHHRLGAVADLDGDGRDDLILGGINNVLGWYNALAAVRIDPPVDQEVETSPTFASSPDSWYALANSLLWYELLPRGIMPAKPEVYVAGSRITFRSFDGSTVHLGLDGLPSGGSPHAPRLRARAKAWEHLREGRRLLAAGSAPAAAAEMKESIAAATEAGDPLLLEAVTRQYGRLLIASGEDAEGESLLTRLASTSPNASEIMFDAAQSLHLRGNVHRAAELYIEGFRRGARPDQGKSKQDFIEGAVLALVEQGRFEEAVAEADNFADAFPDERVPATFFREYARWRSGQVPHADALNINWNATDFLRVCSLEMKLAAGANPEAILRDIDTAAETRSEIRSAIMSLHAEALTRLGRRSEAADLASRAFDLAKSERTRSVWGRALYPVVVERYRRIVGATRKE